jgi:hypothetical protein
MQEPLQALGLPAYLALTLPLHAECQNPGPEVKFETLSGLLVVKRSVDAQGQLLLQMSLPLAPPVQDSLPPSLTTELVHNGPPSIGGVPPSRWV